MEICRKHKVPMDVESDCSICHGDGEIPDPDDFAESPGYVRCWKCNGSGVSSWLDCELCIDEGVEEGLR